MQTTETKQPQPAGPAKKSDGPPASKVKVVPYDKITDLPASTDIRVRILKGFADGGEYLSARAVVDAPAMTAAKWITDGVAERYVSEAEKKAADRSPIINVIQVVGISSEALLERVRVSPYSMPEAGKKIGAQCEALRAGCNLSVKDLAAILRTTVETISAWERGEEEPEPIEWLFLQALVKFGGPLKAWAMPKTAPPPPNVTRIQGLPPPSKQKGESYSERKAEMSAYREDQAVALAGQTQSKVMLLKSVTSAGKHLKPGTIVVVPTEKAQSWIRNATAEVVGEGVGHG